MAMKKAWKRLALICLIFAMLSTSTAASSNGFSDVPETAYYTEAIKWAVEQGITNGVGGGKFGVGKNVSRADAVTLLWRAMGKQAPKGNSNSFVDVPEDAYYRDAVLWAVENEITNGVGEGRFNPAGDVTREQMITFLWRAKGKPDDNAQYKTAWSWAHENGFTDMPRYYHDKAACPREDVLFYIWRGQFGKQKEFERLEYSRNLPISWDRIEWAGFDGFAEHYNKVKNHTIKVGDYYDGSVEAVGHKMTYTGRYDLPCRFMVSSINCNEIHVVIYRLDTMEKLRDDSEDVLYMAEPKQYLEYDFNTYILGDELRKGDIPENTVFLNRAFTYHLGTDMGLSSIGVFESYQPSCLRYAIVRYVDLPEDLYDQASWSEEGWD